MLTVDEVEEYEPQKEIYNMLYGDRYIYEYKDYSVYSGRKLKLTPQLVKYYVFCILYDLKKM